MRRTLPNGDVLISNLDEAEGLEGYVQDDSDPYLFHIGYQSCRYRQDKVIVRPCGKLKPIKVCELNGLKVNPTICKDCTKRNPPD